MKKINWDLLIGVSWIMYLTGIVSSGVGDVPTMSKATTWWSVFNVFCGLLLPLLCGWNAAKKHFKEA